MPHLFHSSWSVHSTGGEPHWAQQAGRQRGGETYEDPECQQEASRAVQGAAATSLAVDMHRIDRELADEVARERIHVVHADSDRRCIQLLLVHPIGLEEEELVPQRVVGLAAHTGPPLLAKALDLHHAIRQA